MLSSTNGGRGSSLTGLRLYCTYISQSVCFLTLHDAYRTMLAKDLGHLGLGDV